MELYNGDAEHRSISSSRTARSSPGARTTAAPTAGVPASDRFRVQADAAAGRHGLLGAVQRAARRRRSRRSATGGSRARRCRFDGEVYHWSKHHEFLKFIDLPRRTRPAVRAGAERASTTRTGRLLERTAGACATPARLLDRRSTPTATTSASRAASSRSPRIRTCGCAAAGSAIAAPATWPRPAGDHAGDGVQQRPADRRGAVRLFDTGGDRGGGRAINATTSGTRAAARRSRASASTTASCWERCSIISVAARRCVAATRARDRAPFPADLVLTPVSRWPTTLPDASVRRCWIRRSRERVRRGEHRRRTVSIVIVTHDGLVFTRLCLESLLAAESSIDFEVVVVDNASTDGTPQYLSELSRDRRARASRAHADNAGFAAATNLGVALAQGDIIVFLNNDTMLVDRVAGPARRALERSADWPDRRRDQPGR